MAYQKTTWESGDIITREKMQKLEDAVADLSEHMNDALIQATENISETANNLSPASDMLLNTPLTSFKIKIPYTPPEASPMSPDNPISDSIFTTVINDSCLQRITGYDPTKQYAPIYEQIPKVIRFNKPVMGVTCDIITGEVQCEYIVVNSADLVFISFNKGEGAWPNYVVYEMPFSSMSGFSTHYKMYNGDSEDFSWQPGAYGGLVIRDSRFTSETAAKEILSNRDNNIYFVGYVGSMSYMYPLASSVTVEPVEITFPSRAYSYIWGSATPISYTYYKDPNSLVNTFRGASATYDGDKGLVPAPAQGYDISFLCGDGTWCKFDENGIGTSLKIGNTILTEDNLKKLLATLS